jgi:hypothetical protein
MYLIEYHCPDCGSTEAYRSRRRTFVEKYLLGLLLLKPVRCARCYRRNSTSVFTPAREREQRPAIPTQAA